MVVVLVPYSQLRCDDDDAVDDVQATCVVLL